MSDNKFQDIFINAGSFGKCDKGVACIMWLVAHAKAEIDFIEASTVLIISQMSTLLTVFIVEEISTFHGKSFIIILFNKLTDAWMDWDSTVTPSIGFKTAGESPCFDINVSYLSCILYNLPNYGKIFTE